MSIKLPGADKVRSLIGMERKRSPTILTDLGGNLIHEGQFLFWLSKHLYVTVTQINPGGLATPDGQVTKGLMVLEIQLPFDASNKAIGLADFLLTQDPRYAPVPTGQSEIKEASH